MSVERKPAVSGAFYPSDPKQLKRMIYRFMSLAKTGSHTSKPIMSCVAPHAGYVYSGGVAAYTYNAIKHMKNLGKIDTFVIIGPNHTGYGYPISVSGADFWVTPLGNVANDKEFVETMAEISTGVTIDEEAHRSEHSVEVQLPFLQSVVEKPRCVFICMGDQSYESAVSLEDAVTSASLTLKRHVFIIASSDFNHYESRETAEKKDMPAIEALERLDAEGFHKLIEKSGNSACGYGPVTVALLYAKRHGALGGKLLRYATSGDVTGDYGSVVAYASLAFC